MKKTTQLKIILTVFGEILSPDSLSKILNMSPTSSGVRGKGENRSSFWEYSIGFISTLYLEDVTDKFTDIFFERTDLLRKFVGENELAVKIYFVIEIYDEEKPAIYFNKKFLKVVNKLDAEIDVDMYFFTAD